MHDVLQEILDYIAEIKRRTKALGGESIGTTYGDGADYGRNQACDEIAVFVAEKMQSYEP